MQNFFNQQEKKKQANTTSGFFQKIVSPPPLESYSGQLVQKIEEHLGSLAQADHEQIFRAFGQKMVHLEMGIKNFIISSGKVASLFVNFSNEEELALRIYESDKQSVENALNNFKNFVIQTLDNVKSSQLKKSVSNDLLLKSNKDVWTTFVKLS